MATKVMMFHNTSPVNFLLMQTENPGGSTDEKTEDNVWIRSDKSALGSRSSGVRDVWTMSGSLSCLRSDHLSNKDCVSINLWNNIETNT